MRVKTGLAIFCPVFLALAVAPLRAADTLPARLDDSAFWKMISDSSEPDGHFTADFYTSNEPAYQVVIPQLAKSVATGGVYVGVGPEQNFTYIAALRPKIAFIVDIRRDILLEHLMYKAIFEMSTDRADFVGMLFSRKRPAELTADSPVQTIFQAYASVKGDSELAEQNLKNILGRLKTMHLDRYELKVPIHLSPVRLSLDTRSRSLYKSGSDSTVVSWESAMNFNKSMRSVVVVMFAMGIVPTLAIAQPGSFGGGYGPSLKVVPPAKIFSTSDEHYKYLFDQAKGGTKQTVTSIPRWDGLWVTAGNTHMDVFIDPPGSGFKGKVKAGVLTPPYEAAYKERWRQQQELGEVQYDRLTHCEPVGYPRWLLEPYSHEFVNLPQESYFINDYGPGIRRIYIGQEHKNVYGTHSWFGDTIGFWDGNKLVTSTKYLLPADFTRWSPMTSNQFESVETWELKQYPGGIERLEVQVTFYDKHAFVKPVSTVYAFRRAKELEAAGHRVQHWECEGSSNDFLKNGTTSSRLPGEEGYKDPRGSTLFPNLPGQSRDPIFNTTLPSK